VTNFLWWESASIQADPFRFLSRTRRDLTDESLTSVPLATSCPGSRHLAGGPNEGRAQRGRPSCDFLCRWRRHRSRYTTSESARKRMLESDVAVVSLGIFVRREEKSAGRVRGRKGSEILELGGSRTAGRFIALRIRRLRATFSARIGKLRNFGISYVAMSRPQLDAMEVPAMSEGPPATADMPNSDSYYARLYAPAE